MMSCNSNCFTLLMLCTSAPLVLCCDRFSHGSSQVQREPGNEGLWCIALSANKDNLCFTSFHYRKWRVLLYLCFFVLFCFALSHCSSLTKLILAVADAFSFFLFFGWTSTDHAFKVYVYHMVNERLYFLLFVPKQSKRCNNSLSICDCQNGGRCCNIYKKNPNSHFNFLVGGKKSAHSQSNAAFRLACRLPHCCFDGDICTTVQAPLATEGRPSGKQHLAIKSVTPAFAHSGRLQTVDFYSTLERCSSDKAKNGVAASSCHSETARGDHTM